MLDRLKQILNITDRNRDTYLQLLLDSAKEEAQSYTGNENIPETLIIEMAIYKFNRLESTGVNSENYSGVSFNYADDYPENIVRRLKKLRVVVFG